MTWRAFIIGILFVAGMACFEPYVSHGKGWGGFSSSSFPGGPVLVIVVLTVGLNVLIKLVRRAWALKQAELMLVWCMLIVAATFPGDGIARFWYPLLASGPYLARRADLAWEEDGALTYAPEKLVLSKSPRSVAAKQYYEGAEGRVPWRYWVTPLAHWAVFFILLYLVVFFLRAILRKHWVESERRMFPLARVPLEFTEGSEGSGLLPGIFREKGFLIGLAVAFAFRLFRALPLFFGKESVIPLALPLRDIFAQTPFEPMSFDNINLWPSAIGFAYLVPADVSLSVWFFYWFARMELMATNWVGLPQYGGTYGRLMSWQQAGAYIAFTVGTLFMARRHLLTVLRKALGLVRFDDSEEPVGYRLAFWGLVLSVAGCLGWYVYHGMNLAAGAAVFALILCWYLVYARMVAQGGLYVGRTIWRLGSVVHGVSGGHLFTGAGAVISNIQDTLLVTGGTTFLAPMAMNAFRISEVFEKRRRRLLVPVLMIAFLVALVLGTYSALTTAYSLGAANMADPWSQEREPRWQFDKADRMIKQPSQSAEAYPGPLLIGAAGMGFMMLMRARLYWWPIHAIGLLTCSSWHAHRLWLPFFLGWLTKVCIMKFSGGRLLRHGRYFFIALIIVEAFVGGVSTIVRAITAGAVPGF